MTYFERYKETHRNPVNRGLHLVGIPSIVLAFPVAPFDWRIALGMFAGGWIVQFVGHAFEGKAPAFFRNPIFLFVGPIWWVKKFSASGSASSATPRSSPAAGNP